jgi:hypothetical protein
MGTMIEMVLASSRAIRGPGKPRIVEPYKPFHAPLDWLKSGAQNALWRQNRLLPVADYVELLKGLDGKVLEGEAMRAGVSPVGDVVAAIAAKLGVTIEPAEAEHVPVVGLECMGFRELQALAKELGINAKQPREALVIAILEAEALDGGQIGD